MTPLRGMQILPPFIAVSVFFLIKLKRDLRGVKTGLFTYFSLVSFWVWIYAISMPIGFVLAWALSNGIAVAEFFVFKSMKSSEPEPV